jgi:N-acetylmuramic acid 6-phosphate etherase
MAGGDYAMVRSLESFEDHPEYGARQLDEAGFRDGDLLLASTEGGETPFVIGAALHAAGRSSQRPVFLYCNPDSVLRRVASRSAAVLDDARIEKLCLETGPMALSGSTRLQASTALMAAVGGALFAHRRPQRLAAWLRDMIGAWARLDTGFLAPFIEAEAEVGLRGGHVRYEADADLAMAILTDTTERAPTFSLPPFSNDSDDPPRSSPCSLRLPRAPDRGTAWRMLLGRAPRGLEWPELGGAASLARVLGFDFSQTSATGPAGNPDAVFRIGLREGALRFALGPAEAVVPVAGLPPLSVHLVLKMILNAHSTLVMGRLGRFDGNVMTWVRPSNHKLVDRAIRYAGAILARGGITAGYAELAEACFALREALPPGSPLVPAMAERIRQAAGRAEAR